MTRYSLTILLISSLFIMNSCAQKNDYLVTIKTPYGDMIAILYDETPEHKKNFVKLAQEHFYDSLLFHRVIPNFMIQGGDPDSKKAVPGQRLGSGGPGYTVPAEFNSKFFHEKGALSAARMSDQVNPTKASSGSQFYVVQGQVMDEQALTGMEQNMQYQQKNTALREVLYKPDCKPILDEVMTRQQANDAEWLNSFFENCDTLIKQHNPEYKPYVFSQEQKQAYASTGGAPHLDGQYTVFGKVIQGLDVIDKIAAVERDGGDRPLQDVRMTVTVEEMPRKKIEKEYGYQYPEQ